MKKSRRLFKKDQRLPRLNDLWNNATASQQIAFDKEFGSMHLPEFLIGAPEEAVGVYEMMQFAWQNGYRVVAGRNGEVLYLTGVWDGSDALAYSTSFGWFMPP